MVRSSALLLLCSFLATSVYAQSIDLTVNDTGLSIGDSRRVNGVRLNFRDRNLREVNGFNVTIWEPYEPVRGVIHGFAIGVPLTGAREINGFGIALGGVSVHESGSGIFLGGLGAGAGRDLSGIVLGGLGAGTGRDLQGIVLGGLGAGSGRDVVGIAIGGLGVGSGRDIVGIAIGGLGAGGGANVRGVVIGGLGAAAGGDFDGIGLGGLGVGAGGSVTGIMIGGLGVGAGGDIRGLMIGGAGVGAGGTFAGIGLSAGGVGAPRMRGLFVSGVAAGGKEITGLVIATAYLRVTEGGHLTGASIAAFNRIQGRQNGLSIGLLNMANHLNGIQLGLLNIARNNPRGLRVLPLVNAHFD